MAGADPAVRDVLGDAVFLGDVLASGGLVGARRAHVLQHVREFPVGQGGRARHRRARPLIVDEAWGAHLPFRPDLPSWAMDAGADICVTSIHKVGSGLEQGSVFHLRGDLVTPMLLGMRADLLGTTSPSVLIFTGLDGSRRRQMALRGKELMGATLDLAAGVRAAVEEIDGLHVGGREDFCGPGLADDLDPLPCIIDVAGLGITGYAAADWLREHHAVDAHLVDHRRIGAQLTLLGDDQETAGELLAALRYLARAAPGLLPAPRVEVPPPGGLRMGQVRLPCG